MRLAGGMSRMPSRRHSSISSFPFFSFGSGVKGGDESDVIEVTLENFHLLLLLLDAK
jgi:hypothetical protein